MFVLASTRRPRSVWLDIQIAVIKIKRLRSFQIPFPKEAFGFHSSEFCNTATKISDGTSPRDPVAERAV